MDLDGRWFIPMILTDKHKATITQALKLDTRFLTLEGCRRSKRKVIIGDTYLWTTSSKQ